MVGNNPSDAPISPTSGSARGQQISRLSGDAQGDRWTACCPPSRGPRALPEKKMTSVPDSSWLWKGLANKAVSLPEGCQQKALLAWRVAGASQQGCPPRDQPPESRTAEAPPSQRSNLVINGPEGPRSQLFFSLKPKFVSSYLEKDQKLIFEKKEEDTEKVVLILPLRDVLGYVLFAVIFLCIFM